MTPTAARYRFERKKRGTQAAVARALGVHRVTVAKRETGEIPVSHEAWLALIGLPEQKPPRKP